MSTRQWPLAVSSVFVSSAFTSQRLLSLSILLDELRLRTLSEPITQIRCCARKEMWKVCGSAAQGHSGERSASRTRVACVRSEVHIRISSIESLTAEEFADAQDLGSYVGEHFLIQEVESFPVLGHRFVPYFFSAGFVPARTLEHCNCNLNFVIVLPISMETVE